ncbi:hypothetical protein ZOSMA_193G00510 [Zostera marina]|uniref:Uncharacterized protein n=1 Tax=Zostera marina TaxID=29655 RepID=A0A0K9PRF3_ZOSMR|nr:hypothetical protein ZOSMA_193G00510 [Zostera marina]
MSSLTLRRSSALNTGVVLRRGNRLAHLHSFLSILPPRSMSSSVSSVEIGKTSSQSCFSGERSPSSDPWVERSSLLWWLLNDYSPEAIGATLYPVDTDDPQYQRLEDRKSYCRCSLFSRSYPLVLSTAMSLLPPPNTTVQTPPVERFFSPLSLLLNAPS